MGEIPQKRPTAHCHTPHAASSPRTPKNLPANGRQAGRGAVKTSFVGLRGGAVGALRVRPPPCPLIRPSRGRYCSKCRPMRKTRNRGSVSRAIEGKIEPQRHFLRQCREQWDRSIQGVSQALRLNSDARSATLERFPDRCSGCHGHPARAALARRQWHPRKAATVF